MYSVLMGKTPPHSASSSLNRSSCLPFGSQSHGFCSPKSPQHVELGVLTAAPRLHGLLSSYCGNRGSAGLHSISVRFANSDLCPELLFFSSSSFRKLFFWFYLYLCHSVVFGILVPWPHWCPLAGEAGEKPQGNSLELLFLGWFCCVCLSPFNFT